MIPPETRVPRVLVIGLDGGTFDVLVPLAEAGVMPNLAALLRESALASLGSTLPCITPVAWTTFLTGADPEAHGIWDYRYYDPGSRRTLLAHAGRIPMPTLLDAVSLQGGEVVSIDLPMTWPPAAGWRGVVLGGLGTPSTAAALAAHPDFRRQLAEAGVAYSLDPIWRRRPETWPELCLHVARTEAAFRARAAAAALADRCHDWRLMIVQFQHLDGLQHRTWHLLGPPISEGADPAWCREVRRAYRALDDCLGKLLELADARRAAVIVLSDHGFGPFVGQIVMPELLRRGGLLAYPNTWGRVGQAGARAVWRLRKFLYRHVAGASTAHLARPVSAVLNVDWRRTAALTLHGNLAALVYLNTPERFGTRALSTPRVREQALCDVLGVLADARHPETGQRLFVQFLSPQAHARSESACLELPEVAAIPAPGFHTRHKGSPSIGWIRAEPMLTGTHRREGILACKAPGVAGGAFHAAELRDVAPTILWLLGIPAPNTMRGRVLLNEPADAAHPASGASGPVRPQAASHEAASVGGLAGKVSLDAGAAVMSERDEALVLGRLRDLGYVE
jgi:predicted AlkP superfamily phosphohydrolase/phosphomutase